MATKSELEDLIDVNLADESEIIALRHREVEHAFVGELYPDVFVDTKDTPPQKILCLQPEKIHSYTFITSKSGNMVTIQGAYRTSTVTGIYENLFQITDENFEAPASHSINICTTIFFISDGNQIQSRISRIIGDKIQSTILNPINSDVFFSITYRAK